MYSQKRSYPHDEVRGGGQEEQPHVQGAVAAQVQEGLEELLHVQSSSGGVAERRYSSSKVRSSGCALLEQLWRDTHVQGKKNPSKMIGVARGHQKADTLKT